MEIYKILRKLDILSIGDIPLAQSKVYLLTQLGVDVGFSFDWMGFNLEWYGGPFSNRFAAFLHGSYFDEVYVDGVPVEELVEDVVLDEAIVGCIAVVNGLEKHKPKTYSSREWYGLLAKVLYIYNNSYYFNIALTKQSVLNFYINSGFGEESWNFVDQANQVLVAYDFISEIYL